MPLRQPQLDRLTALFQSPPFELGQRFTRADEGLVAETIRLLDELLQYVDGLGGRVAFREDVGTYGKIQDITSLVSSMAWSVRQSPIPDRSSEQLIPEFNFFYGTGVGYFANGVQFVCTHDNDLALFIGRDRAYLRFHLLRAFQEASRYLRASTPQNT